MKKILGILILPLLFTLNISASKSKLRIISDTNIIDAVTKDLPQENRIKKILKRIVENPKAIEAIKKATKNDFVIVRYLTKAQLFAKLFASKTKELSKNGMSNAADAAKWSWTKIKENKIKTGTILTSTGLIITGYIYHDTLDHDTLGDVCHSVANSDFVKFLSSYLGDPDRFYNFEL